MGPKFVIAFSGVDTDSVADFINDLKNSLEKEKISLNDENGNIIENQETNVILNFVLSTYYKGTGIDEVLKKLEEYLDNASKTESDITNI